MRICLRVLVRREMPRDERSERYPAFLEQIERPAVVFHAVHERANQTQLAILHQPMSTFALSLPNREATSAGTSFPEESRQCSIPQRAAICSRKVLRSVIITLDAPSPLAALGDKVADWARTEYEDLAPGTITQPPERMHGDREGLNDGSLIKVDSARELTILSDGSAK